MSTEPVATYRLQLHRGFAFSDAAKIAPYLAALGVSHVYCSPIWQATPGSTHGYDVVDPGRISADLGGDAGWRKFVSTLQENGLRLVLDIVPNHMAVHWNNAWWRDVLEHGPHSRYACFFDIDWDSADGQVLLPVLGDHYGRVLEDGELSLLREDHFILCYHEHRFPIDPATQGPLLRRAAATCASSSLCSLADAFERLQMEPQARRDLAVLRGRLDNELGNETVRAAIDDELERINADADALGQLLARQNYRLAFWRMAQESLGYRRFFDIHSLAGLRMEENAVFDAVHERVLQLCREGVVDGLRVDHPDGLRDPASYFERLRSASSCHCLLVEKILASDETLPGDWPVEGTTGYEFLNLAGGLFVHAAGLKEIERFYREFTGAESSFADIVRDSKRLIATRVLGSELNRLVERLRGICQRHRRYRDYGRVELRAAITAIASCFPVYRSYVRAEAGVIDTQDASFIAQAARDALESAPDADPALLHFIRDILLLRVQGELESEFVMRFQQFTAPLMAKGLEDTALFRFIPLVCCNEVGSNPAAYPVTPDAFHAACVRAREGRPRALLATDTHDTKFSADVRARLAVLSEVPSEWTRRVSEWSRRVAAEAPDREVEYLFYQVLVGAWPLDQQRAQAFMQKAAREAKRHTSWLQQDEGYEQRLDAFVAAAFRDASFIEDVQAFVRSLQEAAKVNGLSQTLLKLVAPGVPDIYQGTELQALSLVDPDNRREVDFAARAALLGTLSDDTSPEAVVAQDDLAKLWLIRQTLRVRREHAASFSGEYRPLPVEGGAIACRRGRDVVAVAPRFWMSGKGEATLALPPGRWRNRFTHEIVEGGVRDARALFRRFPVTLLTREMTT